MKAAHGIRRACYKLKVLVYDYSHQKSFSRKTGTFLFCVKLFFLRGVTPLLTQNFNDKLKNFAVTPLEDGTRCHTAALPDMPSSVEGGVSFADGGRENQFKFT